MTRNCSMTRRPRSTASSASRSSEEAGGDPRLPASSVAGIDAPDISPSRFANRREGPVVTDPLAPQPVSAVQTVATKDVPPAAPRRPLSRQDRPQAPATGPLVPALPLAYSGGTVPCGVRRVALGAPSSMTACTTSQRSPGARRLTPGQLHQGIGPRATRGAAVRTVATISTDRSYAEFVLGLLTALVFSSLGRRSAVAPTFMYPLMIAPVVAGLSEVPHCRQRRHRQPHPGRRSSARLMTSAG